MEDLYIALSKCECCGSDHLLHALMLLMTGTYYKIWTGSTKSSETTIATILSSIVQVASASELLGIIQPVTRLTGQIELYTHHPLLPTLMSHLSRLGIRLCGVYLLDSQFMEDRYKYFRYEICPSQVSPTFVSGVMSAMSAMVNFSVPWINIMSKMDLVSGDARNGVKGRRDVARYVSRRNLTLLYKSPRFQISRPRSILDAIRSWSAKQHRAAESAFSPS